MSAFCCLFGWGLFSPRSRYFRPQQTRRAHPAGSCQLTNRGFCPFQKCRKRLSEECLHVTAVLAACLPLKACPSIVRACACAFVCVCVCLVRGCVCVCVCVCLFNLFVWPSPCLPVSASASVCLLKSLDRLRLSIQAKKACLEGYLDFISRDGEPTPELRRCGILANVIFLKSWSSTLMRRSFRVLFRDVPPLILRVLHLGILVPPHYTPSSGLLWA